jgi:hypothetical protein
VVAGAVVVAVSPGTTVVVAPATVVDVATVSTVGDEVDPRFGRRNHTNDAVTTTTASDARTATMTS